MVEPIPQPNFTFDGRANDVDLTSRLTSTFKVKWICSYPHINEGLPFEATQDMICSETDTKSINSCRNIQELSEETGSKLCALIEEHIRTFEKKSPTYLPYHEAHPEAIQNDGNTSLHPESLETECLTLVNAKNLYSPRNLILSSLQSSSFSSIFQPDSLGIHLTAIFPLNLLPYLPAQSPLVFISAYSTKKIFVKHPEIKSTDYYYLQYLLDCGEAVKETRPQYPRHIIFILPEKNFFEEAKRYNEGLLEKKEENFKGDLEIEDKPEMLELLIKIQNMKIKDETLDVTDSQSVEMKEDREPDESQSRIEKVTIKESKLKKEDKEPDESQSIEKVTIKEHNVTKTEKLLKMSEIEKPEIKKPTEQEDNNPPPSTPNKTNPNPKPKPKPPNPKPKTKSPNPKPPKEPIQKKSEEMYYVAVLKSTTSGEEIFLQTFYLSSIAVVNRTRKRGILLRKPKANHQT
eukprot:TRINITY_DN1197_c0_g2_i1.p1 TRINITY_DN1197_c0_g2~~TRINITY_DN1197_c0_g2_i1.p1  ORF type:complete len:530 (-),score=172.02 TRINITY_DN1197_c0_g2_i1:111-1493(-)